MLVSPLCLFKNATCFLPQLRSILNASNPLHLSTSRFSREVGLRGEGSAVRGLLAATGV